MGCIWVCVKCIAGVFLAEKQGKIQPGVFLLFSQAFYITVIQYFPSFHAGNNVQKKLEFFAHITATMMCYVICPGLILKTLYLLTLNLSTSMLYDTRMTCVLNAGKRIYTYREL